MRGPSSLTLAPHSELAPLMGEPFSGLAVERVGWNEDYLVAGWDPWLIVSLRSAAPPRVVPLSVGRAFADSAGIEMEHAQRVWGSLLKANPE